MKRKKRTLYDEGNQALAPVRTRFPSSILHAVRSLETSITETESFDINVSTEILWGIESWVKRLQAEAKTAFHVNPETDPNKKDGIVNAVHSTAKRAFDEIAKAKKALKEQNHEVHIQTMLAAFFFAMNLHHTMAKFMLMFLIRDTLKKTGCQNFSKITLLLNRMSNVDDILMCYNTKPEDPDYFTKEVQMMLVEIVNISNIYDILPVWRDLFTSSEKQFLHERQLMHVYKRKAQIAELFSEISKAFRVVVPSPESPEKETPK